MKECVFGLYNDLRVPTDGDVRVKSAKKYGASSPVTMTGLVSYIDVCTLNPSAFHQRLPNLYHRSSVNTFMYAHEHLEKTNRYKRATYAYVSTVLCSEALNTAHVIVSEQQA